MFEKYPMFYTGSGMRKRRRRWTRLVQPLDKTEWLDLLARKLPESVLNPSIVVFLRREPISSGVLLSPN